MHFALVAHDKPDSLQLRLDTRPAHIEFLDGLNAAGTLAFAGPFIGTDGKPNGSMVVIDAPSLDEAKATFAMDPYAKAGLFGATDVRQWNWTYNKPEK